MFWGVKSTFRTLSALLNHTWAIEPISADAHLPLVEAYLSGKLAGVSLLTEEEANRPIGFGVSSEGERLALRDDGAGEEAWTGRPFANPNLPAGTVAVLDIRGVIMKEGLCWSYGTEDYAQALRDVYDNDRITGAVLLVDSPGGQLAGTPTLFDQVIRPEKPTVGVVQDGMAGSAAYWFLSGCNHIFATQKTDQIGSIGVFVRLRDNTKQLLDAGIKELNIYANLSSDKNRPYRDALSGKPDLLKAELDQAARFFRLAVEEGRAGKLNLAAGDPFTGSVYYASEAIQIGLIDGFGDLNAAVAKVSELASQSTPSRQAAQTGSVADTTPLDSFSTATPVASTPAGDPAIMASEPTAGEEATPTTPNPLTAMPFGYQKITAIMAISGLAADQVTAAHVDAINAELADLGCHGITAVTNADFAQAQTDAATVATQATQITGLQTQVATLTTERNEARQQATDFGSQPGSVASRAPKTEEPTATADQHSASFYCETDAELDRMKAKLSGTK